MYWFRAPERIFPLVSFHGTMASSTDSSIAGWPGRRLDGPPGIADRVMVWRARSFWRGCCCRAILAYCDCGVTDCPCRVLGAVGMDVAPQRSDARRDHFDTAWTFHVLFGLGSAIVVACCLARRLVYGDSRLVPVMLMLAATHSVQAFENIGVVAFRKEWSSIANSDTGSAAPSTPSW